MADEFKALIAKTASGAALTREEASHAFVRMMSGEATPSQMGGLLMALRVRGETVDEITGAVSAMRDKMTKVAAPPGAIDVVGTGGDASGSYNISTCAAFIVAGAGVPVAKHGNRSITSRSGSADVLAELGVNLEADIPQVERCLDELGICFCFAQRMHPAMRHVAPVRKKLGIRTIFNVLGPLSNPAGASSQLLGAGRPELRPLLATALRLLGAERALVISGEDGLGEVTLAGATHVTEVGDGRERELTLQPEEFGLAVQSLDPLRVTSPAESAAKIRQVLSAERSPARDIVVLNAAAGLMAFDAEIAPRDAAARAAEAIDSGAAAGVLERLAALSHAS
jgi:anthranilate phosphoribosyltransferase